MVSISNSVSSTAYTKSAQLGSAKTPDPSQTRAKPLKSQDNGTANKTSFVQETQKATRTDLPENAKAASNDSARFKDNTTDLQETHDTQTLNTEAQRGSLLDLAV